MSDTGKHAIPPAPLPRRRRGKKSPLPWQSTECDFSDEPTEVRRVAEPVARAVREQLEQPWYVRVAIAVAITLAAGAIAWSANALVAGSANDAVHETQIGDLGKRVDRVEAGLDSANDKLDQVLLELRRDR